MKKFVFICVFGLFCSISVANSTTIGEFELKLVGVSSNWQNTINICDDAIKLYPHRATFYYEKAYSLSQLSRYHEAIENYDLAIKYNQEPFEHIIFRGDLYFFKGQSLESLGQFEEALKNYKLAIEHGNDDRWVYFAIAGVERKLQEEKKE